VATICPGGALRSATDAALGQRAPITSTGQRALNENARRGQPGSARPHRLGARSRTPPWARVEEQCLRVCLGHRRLGRCRVRRAARRRLPREPCGLAVRNLAHTRLRARAPPGARRGEGAQAFGRRCTRTRTRTPLAGWGAAPGARAVRSRARGGAGRGGARTCSARGRTTARARRLLPPHHHPPEAPPSRRSMPRSRAARRARATCRSTPAPRRRGRRAARARGPRPA
jgi:hypothetical protein